MPKRTGASDWTPNPNGGMSRSVYFENGAEMIESIGAPPAPRPVMGGTDDDQDRFMQQAELITMIYERPDYGPRYREALFDLVEGSSGITTWPQLEEAAERCIPCSIAKLNDTLEHIANGLARFWRAVDEKVRDSVK